MRFNRGMTEVPFRLVDVFTERPLAGNQLCVVPDPVELDEDRMLAVAREIGFSETTFVTGRGEAEYDVRIFTPGGELPFAGHPTLGTAFTLVVEGLVASPVIQHARAGDFPVEIDLDRGFGWMRQLPPTFGEEVDAPGTVAEAVGLTPADLAPDPAPQVVSTGLAHLVAPVAGVEALVRASWRPRPLEDLLTGLGAEGIYLYAETAGGVKARMFDPHPGIGEDPATGSAAGPLGAYLAARGLAGMPGTVVVRQGEEIDRPGELHVEVLPDGASWAVRVGGGVRIVGRGVLEV